MARQIVGVLHAERFEHIFLSIVAEGHAGNLLEYALQCDEVEAAVLEIGAWFEISFASGDILDKRVAIGSLAELFAEFVRRNVGRNARSVSEQMLNANGALVFAVLALPTLEARDVGAHSVLKAHIALLDKRHKAHRCAERLAARCHIEDGVGSHRFGGGNNLAIAVGFKVSHLAVLHHGEHGAGNFLIVDGVVDDSVGVKHQFRIDAHLLRSDAR